MSRTEIPTTHETIDRIAPTLAPAGRAVMRQGWYDLVFLHWPVAVETLRQLVPPELEIDTFEGKAYIGLVPFAMRGVRPTWAPPVPGISDFLEINVRTYVHLRGRDPGVWFFSLDADQSLAVQIARTFWNLPYRRAAMSLERDRDGEIAYTSRRLWPGPLPATCSLACRPEGEAAASKPGTLEHFLAERYYLYAKKRRLFRGQVHHSPYPLQPARVVRLDESMLAAAGIERPECEPLAHYARGVEVRIFPLRAISTSENSSS